MLKIKSPILNFFELVLRVAFELTPNARHKGSEIAKVLSKEELEFFSEHRNICALVKYVKMLILSLIEVNTPAKKKSSKRGAVGLSDPSGVEIIFALPVKVVTVYV